MANRLKKYQIDKFDIPRCGRNNLVLSDVTTLKKLSKIPASKLVDRPYYCGAITLIKIKYALILNGYKMIWDIDNPLAENRNNLRLAQSILNKNMLPIDKLKKSIWLSINKFYLVNYKIHDYGFKQEIIETLKFFISELSSIEASNFEHIKQIINEKIMKIDKCY